MLILLLLLAPLAAQTPTPEASPSPVAFPLGEIASQVETTMPRLTSLDAELAEDPADDLEVALGKFERDLEGHLAEVNHVLTTHPSLEALRDLTEQLQAGQDELTTWRTTLAGRATWIDEQMKELEALAPPWKPTLEAARAARVPADLVGRIELVLQSIERIRHQAHVQRARILALQDRILTSEDLIVKELNAVGRERTLTVNRIWWRDSPPIWDRVVRPDDASLQESVNAQWNALAVYCQEHVPRFFLHVVIIALLALLLRSARVWLRPFTQDDPDLKRTAEVFRVPFATAVALSVGLSHVIYPFAPPMLLALMGVFALVPTRVILGRMMERRVLPVLDMLVVFYFLDLLRAVFAPLSWYARMIFLGEMAAGVVVLGWLLWTSRSALDRGLASMGALIFGLACGAGTVGFASLGYLLGNAALQCAYIGVVVIAGAQIANGLAMLGIHVPPLGLLGSIRNHRELIRQRSHRIIGLLAGLAWVGFSLQVLGLQHLMTAGLAEVFTADLRMGALRFTLGDVLAFPVVLYVAVQLSRFTRFVLDEDIYPRVTLPTGVPYALSTMLHYSVLTLGFIIALSAMGIDTSRFTIVAGALGVGVGLGLQNVVNNLVSGLILLFERPFRVGDCITFKNLEGDLMSIGLRASIFKTSSGADVIVPNAMLISNEVINWTLAGRSTRRMDIDVLLDYGVDIKKITTTLCKVAAMSPYVAKSPAPRTVLVDFGESSMRFQVQVWMADASIWSLTRNDVLLRVEAAMRTMHVHFPTAARSLHLETINPRILEQLRDWPKKSH